MTDSKPADQRNERDIRNFLSDAQLAILRDGYDRATLDHVAVNVAATPYLDGAGMVQAIGEHLYTQAGQTGRMTPQQRERTLIGILLATGSPSFAVAIHMYWGLMEELSITDVAEIVTLASAYSGVQTFTGGFFTMTATLKELAAAADEGGDAVSSGAILQRLVAAFPR